MSRIARVFYKVAKLPSKIFLGITKYCLQNDCIEDGPKTAEFNEKIRNLIREFDAKTVEDHSKKG